MRKIRLVLINQRMYARTCKLLSERKNNPNASHHFRNTWGSLLSGDEIRIGRHADSKVSTAFSQSILEGSELRIRKHWISTRRLFASALKRSTGTARPPRGTVRHQVDRLCRVAPFVVQVGEETTDAQAPVTTPNDFEMIFAFNDATVSLGQALLAPRPTAAAAVVLESQKTTV